MTNAEHLIENMIFAMKNKTYEDPLMVMDEYHNKRMLEETGIDKNDIYRMAQHVVYSLYNGKFPELMEKDKEQTFSEWLFKFLRDHDDVTFNMSFNSEFGTCYIIELRRYSDYSRTITHVRYCLDRYMYLTSKLTIDEMLIEITKHLYEQIKGESDAKEDRETQKT